MKIQHKWYHDANNMPTQATRKSPDIDITMETFVTQRICLDSS